MKELFRVRYRDRISHNSVLLNVGFFCTFFQLRLRARKSSAGGNIVAGIKEQCKENNCQRYENLF